MQKKNPSRNNREGLCLRRESNPHGRCGPQDFLTTMVFTTLLVCSLDYAFTLSFDLGAPCLVSTRSLSGFARYSHLKGFAEFTEFYIFNFSKCTQILFIQRTTSKSCVSTSSTTKASFTDLKKIPNRNSGF